jgi:hypothetical protein
MLKEAVCFLFVTQILLTQIGDFITAPPHSSYMSKERRRHGRWRRLGSGLGGMSLADVGVPGSDAQRAGFYSSRVNRTAFLFFRLRSIWDSVAALRRVVSVWSARRKFAGRNVREAGFRALRGGPRFTPRAAVLPDQPTARVALEST